MAHPKQKGTLDSNRELNDGMVDYDYDNQWRRMSERSSMHNLKTYRDYLFIDGKPATLNDFLATLGGKTEIFVVYLDEGAEYIGREDLATWQPNGPFSNQENLYGEVIALCRTEEEAKKFSQTQEIHSRRELLKKAV